LLSNLQCIRPTLGTFADYKPEESLLHCGISDSRGRVYNFEYQLHIDEPWQQCLSIPLQDGTDSDQEWDKQLGKHHTFMTQVIKKRPYDALDHNCYDYVVEFLNKIAFNNSTKHDKESLVLGVVLKPVEDLENFITVHNAVKTKGSHVVKRKTEEESL
jgi:hypothetical protein